MFKPTADFHVGLAFRPYGINNTGHITQVSPNGIATWFYDHAPRVFWTGSRGDLNKIRGNN